MEIPLVLAFAFPSVAQIGIMTDNGHHPALVVIDSLVVDLASILALPGNPVAAASEGVADAGRSNV